MSALRRAFASWDAPIFAPIRPSLIREAAVSDRGPSPDQVAEARREIGEAFAANCLDGLSRRALAFGLANPDDEAVGNGFVRLVREAQRRGNAPSARAVLRAYLGTFDPETEITILLADALAVLKGKLNHARVRSIDGLRLFEPADAVRRIAEALGEQGDDATMRLLIDARPAILSSPLGVHAVARAVTDAAREPSVPTYERLLAHMRGPDGRLSPVAKRHAYAALVQPFTSGDPPEAVKKHIQSVIVSEYGDPRLPSVPAPALAGDPDRAIAEECVAVMKRWLAIDTLDLFIEVIGQTAVDRMFRQRREFWLRYFEASAISDVCVAFGSDAAAVARGIRGKEGVPFQSGTLRGASANQSVLIMRIVDMTVVEWSHNGRMGFWRDGNRSAPKLHQDDYSSFAVKATNGADRSVVHDHGGNWRGKAYRIIQEETGIRP